MKRRTFIQATLLAPAAPAIAGERLHGIPGSIAPDAASAAPRFTLPLSRSGVPRQFWAQLEAVGQTLHDAMRSPVHGRALAADPMRFLQSRGLDASDITLRDESVRLAAALADPGVQGALAARDYAAFFLRMEYAGVLRRAQPARLQQQLEALLAENATTLRALLRERTSRSDFLALLGDEARTVTVDDLTAVREVLQQGMDTPQRMAVLIAIIAIFVSAVVSVGVAMVVAVKVHVWGAAPAAGATLRLDPDLIDNLARSQRIGALVGDPGLAAYALRDTLRAESIALLDAMEATGIARVLPGEREAVIDAMTSYSMKVASP